MILLLSLLSFYYRAVNTKQVHRQSPGLGPGFGVGVPAAGLALMGPRVPGLLCVCVCVWGGGGGGGSRASCGGSWTCEGPRPAVGVTGLLWWGGGGASCGGSWTCEGPRPAVGVTGLLWWGGGGG